MKTLKLENRHIISAIKLLQDINLRGSQSRARSKLARSLMANLEDLKTQEKELLEEYADKDESNNPIQVTEGQYQISERKSEYQVEYIKWMAEKAETQIEDDYLTSLKEGLENTDESFSGEAAETYDLLLDAIENVIPPHNKVEE